VCLQLYAVCMDKSTLAYLLFSGLIVSCLSANVFVDDADPTWTFTGSWHGIAPSHPCTNCTLHPDPSRAFDQTWHDTSGNVAFAQLSFIGVSIQIYTICPPANFWTNFTFTLDNINDGYFVGPSPASSQFIYNYLVYARTNLTNGDHVVNISNDPAILNDTRSRSGLLIDYAIYDDGISVPAPTAASSPVPIEAIIATSVIATLLLMANLAQLLFWYRRSKKWQGRVGGDGMSPPIP
jgi:hypothetical protein